MTITSERIRALREKKGFTQDDLAEHLGMTRVNISNYERGTVSKIPSDVLGKLADILNTSTDYLLGRSDDPFPSTTSPDRGDKLREDSISSEEQDFLKWVEKELKGTFFYDFAGSPEEMKKEMMDDLRVIWKLRKGKSEDKSKK